MQAQRLVLHLPSTHNKNLGVVGQVYNPSLGRQRQADPWGSLAKQPSLKGELKTNERPCLKTKMDGILRNNTRGCLLVFTHMCTYVDMHTYMPIPTPI